MQIKYVECVCSSEQHTIRFIYFPRQKAEQGHVDGPELYMSTFLPHFGFWKRVWNAIKYVCGCNCKYGHFEETVLSPKKAQEIIDLMEDYKKEYQEC
jgi:hypothetical protein